MLRSAAKASHGPLKLRVYVILLARGLSFSGIEAVAALGFALQDIGFESFPTRTGRNSDATGICNLYVIRERPHYDIFRD